MSTEAVMSITAQLDAIESQLERTTVSGRVIDAGDGVTLLRIVGELDLEHGQAVEVTVRDIEEGDQES